jgi:hypothetical protein
MEGHNIPSFPQLSQYTINPPKNLTPDQFLNLQYSPSNFSIVGGKKHVPAKNNKKPQPSSKKTAAKKEPSTMPNKKQPAKKQPAKKQPAKKQPAKKQPAKKQPVKKSAK